MLGFTVKLQELNKYFPVLRIGTMLCNLLLHTLVQHCNHQVMHSALLICTTYILVVITLLSPFHCHWPSAFLTKDVMGKYVDLDIEPIQVAAKWTTFKRLSLQDEYLLSLPVFCLAHCLGEMVGPTLVTDPLLWLHCYCHPTIITMVNPSTT
jgi:hypothetical protein